MKEDQKSTLKYQLQCLEDLLIDCRNLNSSSRTIDRLVRIQENAEYLLEIDIETLTPSFRDTIIELVNNKINEEE